MHFAVACACTAITHPPLARRGGGRRGHGGCLVALGRVPLNWRVGANSPSLWPTMFSVTYTGMNFRPLCTAMVCPTISGITVERRDQVLMTFFSPPRFMTSTFSRSGTSTNGPFFNDQTHAVTSYQLPVDSSRKLDYTETGNWKLETISVSVAR